MAVGSKKEVCMVLPSLFWHLRYSCLFRGSVAEDSCSFLFRGGSGSGSR